MKPEELRIGNLLTLKESNRTIQIRSIELEENNTDYCIYSEILTVHALCEIEPIPLTEEWLVKLGFENSKIDVDLWIYEGIKIWKDKKSFYHINSELLIYFDYVHQLQNICYVLGEELTIKE